MARLGRAGGCVVMRRSAASQIVVIFLSCWLVIVRELSSGTDKTNNVESAFEGQRAGGRWTIRPLGPTAMMSLELTLTAFKFQFQVFCDVFWDGVFCPEIFAM